MEDGPPADYPVTDRLRRNLDEYPIDTRIGLINAFAKFKNKPPSLSGVSEDVRYIVFDEFERWVEDRVAFLMGGGGPTSSETPKTQFTKEETGALKALATRILETQKTIAAPLQATAQKPPTPAAAPPARRPEPIIDSGKWRKAQEGLLDHLSRMERELPESLEV